MTTFSVLICTYNRPEMLSTALRALIERTTERPNQVVVVNGGNERSDCIVQAYQGRTNVEVELVKTINKNLAASRNVGLPYCRGEIIAWTDDDAEVFPDWVTQMKRIHAEHPEAGGVGGAVLGALSNTSLLSRIADLTVFSSPPVPGYVRTIAGVNVSYKRKILEEVGLLDEILFRGEDVDFNWRIKKLGYEIYYDPTIKVIHHHRPTLRGLMNQFYMYGRAYYLVRQKWPEMYSIYPRTPDLKGLKKGGYFLLSTLVEPICFTKQIPSWQEKFIALPLIGVCHLSWKMGIIIQSLRNAK